MDALVQLVFFGEALEGFGLDEVKRRVGQLLKLDEARVAQMFSGQRTVLKRAVVHAEAQRYAKVLAQAGARIHIEASTVTPATQPITGLTATAPPAASSVPTSSSPFPPIDAAGMATPARPSLSAQPLAALPVPTAKPAQSTPALKSLELALLAAPVEEEITCPNCGQRQSKRLLCRFCSTNIEMGIAAKLEAENEARMAKHDALLAKRAMRASPAVTARSPGAFGVGLTGRMGRLKYATSNVWMLTTLYLLVVLVAQKPSVGRFVFFAMGLVAVFCLSLRLAVLRCHDCNKTGWWAMFTLVPSVNAILGLVLSFARGTNGENDYGDEAPRGSWGFFALAGVCLVLAFSFTIKSAIHMAERRAVEHDKETSDVVEFDTRSNDLPSQDARVAFNGAYASARGHKAFAVSPAGAWGMSSGAASTRDALQTAIADCDVKRESYSPKCVPVNLDGQWGPGKGR